MTVAASTSTSQPAAIVVAVLLVGMVAYTLSGFVTPPVGRHAPVQVFRTVVLSENIDRDDEPISLASVDNVPPVTIVQTTGGSPSLDSS